MKKLEIEIPKGHEIDMDKSDLAKGLIVFKDKAKKYPKHVNEIVRRYYITDSGDVHEKPEWQTSYINDVSTKERAEAIIALIQLVELRDAWDEVDGFVKGGERDSVKYAITSNHGEVCNVKFHSANYILQFGSAKTRDLFLETFRDLIETAKEFL